MAATVQAQVRAFVLKYAPERAEALPPSPETTIEAQQWYNVAYATLLAYVHRAGGVRFAAEQVAKKHRFALVQNCFSFEELRRDAALLADAQAAFAAGTATLEQYIRATIQCNLWDSEIRNARIWYDEIRVGDRVRTERGKGIGDRLTLNGRDITNQAGAISAYHYAEYRGNAVQASERDNGRLYSVLVVQH